MQLPGPHGVDQMVCCIEPKLKYLALLGKLISALGSWRRRNVSLSLSSCLLPRPQRVCTLCETGNL